MKKNKLFLVLFIFLFAYHAWTQELIEPDRVYLSSIGAIKFFAQGNQFEYPIIQLGTTDVLALDFDDLGKDLKNFYYTFELCNADWTSTYINPSEFLGGFIQQRIEDYHYSNIATTNYIHYQVALPTSTCYPKYPGNYLLKVFTDGDPTQLAFTRRLLVVDNKVDIATSVVQPFAQKWVNQGQQINMTINLEKLNAGLASQLVNVVILKNYDWRSARAHLQPNFVIGNTMQYNNNDACIFPGGNEYRWVDLRSFKFKGDRVSRIQLNTRPYQLWVVKDKLLSTQPYLQYNDLNGFFEISNTDYYNPWWESDYALTHFTFAPKDADLIAGQNVFMVGELTKGMPLEQTKLQYIDSNHTYQINLFLKQGYYSYKYSIQPLADTTQELSDAITEGNFWETENDYLILVYYRPFGGRYDELAGFATINSRNSRKGFQSGTY
ncbi:MAG: DUF5103 domain-containing protein [Phycisphaerales bacterium]|nr:DUF5103 domain-containing protein [Phycisphaerales bacterium]